MTSSAIRAVIIDDEQKSRSILRSMLNNYCPQVRVVGEAASATEGLTIIKGQQPNLVFLDVEMPHGSGFELLKQLPSLNFEVIFVTGFDFYALQAIKFHALDYLLKPVDIEELVQAVNKTAEVLQQKLDNERLTKLLINLSNPGQELKQIAIPTNDGRVFIPIEEILRCEADGGCTWFYLSDNRRLLSSKNLGEYEKLLPNADLPSSDIFYRVHYGHIINLRFIRSLNRRDSYVEMQDDTTISIAQRRKAPFIELLRQQKLL
ncbi:MAG: LytTR family DNA-binding domain-containing protein [Bacteroidota bacterium]